MPYSQNGWLGMSTAKLQRKYLTVVQVPGTDRRFRVRKGAVATVMEWAATRYHREVESLTAGHPNDDWSFAYRSVRGSGSLSNHSSGTAVDFNATQHPLGTSPSANFTRRERKAIARILTDADGVLRWGGSYSGRKDGMHWEVNAEPKAVKRLARKIQAGEHTMTTPYIYGQAVPMNLEPGVERTVKWDKSDDGVGYALATGGSGGQVDATVDLVFAEFGSDDLAGPANVRVRFYVYDTKTGEVAFYASRYFPLAGPYPTFPGRTLEVTRHGKVYPRKHLRVAVTVDRALRLEAGRCDV